MTDQWIARANPKKGHKPKAHQRINLVPSTERPAPSTPIPEPDEGKPLTLKERLAQKRRQQDRERETV